MDYNKHYNSILLLSVVLMGIMLLASYFFIQKQFLESSIAILIIVIIGYQVIKKLTSQHKLVSDFFDSIKYRDFTRYYDNHTGNPDADYLHQRFNEITTILRNLNTEKETHNIYLAKILAMIQTGILAFDVKTGDIIWINETFSSMLGIPSIKNITFLDKRRQDLFQLITGQLNPSESNIQLNINNQKQNMLFSCTDFEAEQASFRLVVLQNIDDTHNQIESEAWKKLLSVMTHEIMNSIAPIASLTETLQSHIRANMLESTPIDMTDMDAGLETIHRRSEGLMKFAQTYRSLSKITHIDASTLKLADIFEGLKQLMHTEITNKGINLIFQVEPADLDVEVDTYLIEQVLINLILNAADAVLDHDNPTIKCFASRSLEGVVTIKVSDNGKGIPAEVLENIFIPFFTTKKNGSGIGLSLSKQIMLLHKGKILVNSVLDKGTTVSLVFPNNA
ncbi:MAG TPA: HAMP domain-containing sensor histidine kinase [Saprospiraceae bacterium]|nr:HAMP domain-containing sensor histidine kinase [Saprospiraceae bacterium]